MGATLYVMKQKQNRPLFRLKWLKSLLIMFILLIPSTLAVYGSLDNRNAPIHMLSIAEPCAQNVCKKWDCVGINIPGNDYQTCGQWTCTRWINVTCGRWDCTNSEVPGSDYHTCTQWDCTSWYSNLCNTWTCKNSGMINSADDKTCKTHRCIKWKDNVCMEMHCVAGGVFLGDFKTCSQRNCTQFRENACLSWDCTEADVPGNDFQTCDIWKCTQWKDNTCTAWKCIATDIPDGDSQSCDIYECAEWDISRLPDNCKNCISHSECQSKCCDNGQCVAMLDEPDLSDSTCMCQGGVWDGHSCCGDDAGENWCGESGYCKNGQWIKSEADSDVFFCTECKHGQWVENQCCGDDLSLDNWCGDTGRCYLGEWVEPCPSCYICKEGTCSVDCSDTACSQKVAFAQDCGKEISLPTMGPDTPVITIPPSGKKQNKIQVVKPVYYEDEEGKYYTLTENQIIFLILLFTLNIIIIVRIERNRLRKNDELRYFEEEKRLLNEFFDKHDIWPEMNTIKRTYFTQGQIKQIMSHEVRLTQSYARVEDRTDPPVLEFLLLAHAYFIAKRYDDAECYYEKVLFYDESNTEALKQTAFIHGHKGWRSKVTSWNENQVKWGENAENKVTWGQGGQTWAEEREPWKISSEAASYFNSQIEKYNSILSTDPNNKECLVALGDAYFNLHSFEKAIEAYEKALVLDATNAHILFKLSQSYEQIGDHAKGVEYLKQANIYRKKYHQQAYYS